MLVLKYRDPDEAGLINYLNLHHDLLALAQRDGESAKLGGFPNFKSTTEYLPTQVRILFLLLRFKTICVLDATGFALRRRTAFHFFRSWSSLGQLSSDA